MTVPAPELRQIVWALAGASVLLATPAARSERCVLTAARLRLGPRSGRVERLRLCDDTGRLLLGARELRWRGRGVTAKDARVASCRCGPPLSLHAPSAWRNPRGRRLHLSWPVLRIGPVPVFAAPYLALPLEAGVSGLLPPLIAYSGRDGLRLGQGIYLAARRLDLRARGGWIQTRGGFADLRLRAALPRGGGGVLSGEGLRDGESWRGRIWGRVLLRGRRSWLSAAPALISDARYLRELAAGASAVFAPYTASRFAAGLQAGPLTVAVQAALFQPLGHGVDAEPRWLGALSLGIGGVALGPAALSATLSLDGLERGGDGGLGETGGLLLAFAPRLDVARPLEPLVARGRVAYRLRAISTDSGALLGEQALVARVLLGLPLARRYGFSGVRSAAQRGAGFGALAHRLEPFVAAAASAGEALKRPFFQALPLARLRVIEVGLRSTLAQPGPGRWGALTLRGLYEGESERWLAAGDLRLELTRVDLQGRVVADLSGARVPWLEVSACASPWAPLRLCGGYLRQRAEQLWPLFEGWEGPPSSARLPAGAADRLLAGVTLDVGRVQLSARLRVDPLRGVLTHGDYLLAYRCACFSAGLRGASYRGRTSPDLLLSVSLAPGTLGACLERLSHGAR
ncbi:MAG: hypothetical protein CSA65_04725 [Proteobacteria bacterium]|nr:MAG: hypothetical protein CSA65_04725 [Pseudomonadota bacterium]